VHQLVAGAGLDALDAAPGELRAAGWPAAELPDCGQDTELDGWDLIADRLDDEVSLCPRWRLARHRSRCRRPGLGRRRAGPHRRRRLLLLHDVLRVDEPCAADVADLGEDRGHRVLRVVRKGARKAKIPLTRPRWRPWMPT